MGAADALLLKRSEKRHDAGPDKSRDWPWRSGLLVPFAPRGIQAIEPVSTLPSLFLLSSPRPLRAVQAASPILSNNRTSTLEQPIFSRVDDSRRSSLGKPKKAPSFNVSPRPSLGGLYFSVTPRRVRQGFLPRRAEARYRRRSLISAVENSPDVELFQHRFHTSPDCTCLD